MKFAAIFACIVVLLAGAAGSASAASGVRTRAFFDPKTVQPGDEYGKQGNRWCRRLCSEDRSPCDPMSFKRADGRCRLWD